MDYEVTTSTVSAMIFFEMGCLVPTSLLEEEDIERVSEAVVPHEMGLTSIETYKIKIRSVCNDILIRVGFITHPINNENLDMHTNILKYYPN